MICSRRDEVYLICSRRDEVPIYDMQSRGDVTAMNDMRSRGDEVPIYDMQSRGDVTAMKLYTNLFSLLC